VIKIEPTQKNTCVHVSVSDNVSGLFNIKITEVLNSHCWRPWQEETKMWT